MEEKLVKVLLDQYKEKGIDMYALLDDNFFKELSLQLKVDFIKKHAQYIADNTSRTLSKKDIGALVFDGGLSGVMTGVTAGLAAREAGKYFVRGHTPYGWVAGAALLGAGLAAGSSYLKGNSRFKQRTEILRKIDQTVKNPTDENALSVLTTRNTQLNPVATAALQSSALSHLASSAKNVPNMILSQVDPYIKFKAYEMNNNRTDGNYAPGRTQEEFMADSETASSDLLKNLNDSIASMKNNILGK